MDEDFNLMDGSSFFLDDSSYFEEPEDVQRAIYARQSKLWKVKVCCVLGIINHREKRKAIARRERLAICLRFLATGDCYQSIAHIFRTGRSTVNNIIVETCIALYSVLAVEYLAVPTAVQWRKIAIDFSRLWNAPNCVGAVDGKHVAIKCPPHSGSDYYNYKKFFSLVLMATCDANYVFTTIDVGAYGREGDSSIYSSSNLCNALENKNLGLPGLAQLVYSDPEVYLWHYFFADDAYPLKTYMLKPYPGRLTGLLSEEKRIYNYRLSRARRTIENAFGILANRFRIFMNSIHAKPENVEHIIRACIVLHNLLIKKDSKFYADKELVDHFGPGGELVDGGWRMEGQGSCFTNLAPVGGIELYQRSKASPRYVGKLFLEPRRSTMATKIG